MAKPRTNLSEILHELCPNVYFQPPGGHRLTYPCIIYSLSDIDVRHADNQWYTMHDAYSVTYITRDPDDPVIHELAKLPMCRLNRPFSSDNLHHYEYTIYN